MIGFEPVRGQFESAAGAGRREPTNVTLEHAGLWSEPGETEIRVAGPVSKMTRASSTSTRPWSAAR